MRFRMMLMTSCDTRLVESLHNGFQTAYICLRTIKYDEASLQFCVFITQNVLVLIYSLTNDKVGVFEVFFEDQTECVWSANQNVAHGLPCIFIPASRWVVSDVFAVLSMLLSDGVLAKQWMFSLWGHFLGFCTSFCLQMQQVLRQYWYDAGILLNLVFNALWLTSGYYHRHLAK